MTEASSFYGSGSESEDNELLLQLTNNLRDPRKRQAAFGDLWTKLHERFERQLANRIAQHLQGKVTAESAVQAGFKSAWSACQKDKIDWERTHDIAALFFVICENKLLDSVGKFECGKRNPEAAKAKREQRQVEDAAARDGGDSSESHGQSGSSSAHPDANNLEAGVFDAGQAVAMHPKLVSNENQMRMAVPPNICDLPAESVAEWLATWFREEDPFITTIVREKIDTLDDDLKQVVRLRYLEGHALEDVARLMNRTVKEIRTKIAAIEEAFLDLYDDSQFGYHAPRERPKESP